MGLREGTPSDFDPPRDYAFEPELAGASPRFVDARVEQGPYARDRRRRLVTAFGAGLTCLLLTLVPGIDALAYYAAPLVLLEAAGLAACGAAVIGYLLYVMGTGRFRYVREGVPLVARVVDLAKEPSIVLHRWPIAHAFTATVLFRDPASGSVAHAHVKSGDFSRSSADEREPPFAVGDYVTAVYLPDAPEASLQLYAFLELSPEVHLRRGASPRVASAWKAVAAFACALVLLVAFFADLYALGTYRPLDVGWARGAAPMAAGALLLGLPAALALFRARRARGVGGWLLRGTLALAAPLFGAVTALSFCFMANARLDPSVSRPVPAVIEGRTMTMPALLFRRYEVQYRLADSTRKRTLLTTPENLAQFADSRGLAWVRDGRFGWRWVETVSP